MVNLFETQLVKAKITTWNVLKQDYDKLWLMGYVAPCIIDENGPVMSFIVTLKDELIFLGDGQELYTAKTFGENEVLWDTVGRVTDLKDDNGRKIFEGDIVSARFISNDARFNFKVMYNNGGWAFNNGCVNVRRKDIYEVYVVGNIHDNPDLMNQEHVKC